MEKNIQHALSLFTANVWEHFGFKNNDGRKELEITHAIFVKIK